MSKTHLDLTKRRITNLQTKSNKKKYDANYERIFGKKEKKKEHPDCELANRSI